MSSPDITKPKDESHKGDEADIFNSKVLVNPDLMGDAVDAENREHEMGMWAAVKSHPWACLWVFIMCFTIVSLFLCIRLYFQFLDLESWEFASFVQNNS